MGINHENIVGSIDPSKYVTFNRAELMQALQHVANVDRILKRTELTDAVVIRRQDLFAGPALHGYAAAIGVAIRMGDPASMGHLREVANYFNEHPIELKVGELVRVYLSNMTEFDLINSFHLHGNMFNLYRSGTSTQQGHSRKRWSGGAAASHSSSAALPATGSKWRL